MTDDRFRLLPLTQGPGRLPGAAEPSPERVICPDGGLGVGTRVYGHQRPLGLAVLDVKVVRSSAQMGGVPAYCRFSPIGLL